MNKRTHLEITYTQLRISKCSMFNAATNDRYDSGNDKHIKGTDSVVSGARTAQLHSWSAPFSVDKLSYKNFELVRSKWKSKWNMKFCHENSSNTFVFDRNIEEIANSNQILWKNYFLLLFFI